MGADYPDEAVDAVLMALADRGRLGRKAGAGFYAYGEGGAREGLWPGLAGIWPHAAQQPDVAEVQARLLMIQTLEAVRAHAAGVLTDIREGDVGAILGWGFAPWSGGPFSWIDMQGAGAVVATCEGLAARHGARFAPPPELREMAVRGARFYPAEAG
jgi:3-hydroxyacyl-CoA dehydrogenase/enoyl-CoA hydratase/3-hydroxybutyryl-CoA epimerase